MKPQSLISLTFVTALTACSGGMNAVPAANTAGEPQVQAFAPYPSAAQLGLWPRQGPSVRVCADVPTGYARCQAWLRTDVRGMIQPNVPSGYTPADLQTAYSLTRFSAGGGSGETVAIVDAYVNPNAEADLNAYRKEFGLPECSVSNRCFSTKAFGSESNVDWAGEESLDVDMVSAICPHCKILLVEASNASIGALTTAERYATAHAGYVSNSWSGNEGITRYDDAFKVSGVAITAATGDNGHNATAQWPAILPSVVAVGGTALNQYDPRREFAWSGAGSGCSKIYAKPSYQSTLKTGCAKRAQADVSADADPYTGVAVYDSFHQSGWAVFGGTSAATPIIASVFALAGDTAHNNTDYLYAHSASLNDITTGSNGTCGIPLCSSKAGWDGPTGLGTPNGISSF